MRLAKAFLTLVGNRLKAGSLMELYAGQCPLNSREQGDLLMKT